MKLLKIASRQMSDSVLLTVLLTVSGGFMDAYSYLGRGQVFANAQTGNLLLLGVHLTAGKWENAPRYLFPIIAFSFGIACASLLRRYFNGSRRFHWRQMVVLAEACILFFTAFFPQEYNMLANTLLSLACGAQVESFRKMAGTGVATTMCIGNLRTATVFLCDFMCTRSKPALKTSLLFYGLLLSFVAGAVLGNAALQRWQEKSIWGSVLLLLVCFFLMMVHEPCMPHKDSKTDKPIAAPKF